MAPDLKRLAALVGLSALVVAGSVTSASAESSVSGLSGRWSGGGSIRLSDGTSERLTCRATYSPRQGGAGLGLSLRCASQSYKIELRSSLAVSGNRVSGTWEETQFNAGGSIAGQAADGSLRLSFSGTMTGTLSVSYGASQQRVSITTSGGGLSSVSLSLSRS